MKSGILLLWGIFILVFNTSAQTMKTIAILNNLQPYVELLDQLETKIPVQSAEVSKQVSIEYSFIILELNKIDKDGNARLYLEVQFEIKGRQIVFGKLYCEDKASTEELELLIKKNKHVHLAPWNEKSDAKVYLNKKVSEYLEIADRIAETTMNCNSGDDYRPGFYSAITLTKSEIILAQVNLKNSRSSYHKDDYNMRKLEMRIPIHGQVLKDEFDIQKIGIMQIGFSDSSSKNNKDCGDKMEEKIREEIAAFNKTH